MPAWLPGFRLAWGAAAILAATLYGPAQAQPAGVCEAAGADAEREAGIPPGLLVAIGHIESGRRDPASGGLRSWPWAINAAGEGMLPGSSDAAIGLVRSLQAQGVRSIDTGCFQINMQAHPSAFSSLEEAFDPAANARYAARFLASLQAQSGSWDDAVARYHSANPERGGPYRDRVLNHWSSGGITLAAAEPVMMPPAANVRAALPRELVMRSFPVSTAIEMHIWTPATAAILQVSAKTTKLPVVQIPSVEINYR